MNGAPLQAKAIMKKDDESIAEEIDVVGTLADVLVLRLRSRHAA